MNTEAQRSRREEFMQRRPALARAATRRVFFYLDGALCELGTRFFLHFFERAGFYNNLIRIAVKEFWNRRLNSLPVVRW